MLEIKPIIEVAQQAVAPVTIKIDGRDYAPAGRLQLIEAPTVAPLQSTSLQAVVDYLKAQPDGEAQRFLLMDATTVEVYSAPDAVSKKRTCWLRVNGAQDWKQGAVGRFYSQVEFIVWLQTCFESNADQQRALSVAANIKAEKVVEGSDNGIAQVVAVRRGARSEYEEIQNPFWLAPFRTFAEIEPVASPFILRLQNGKEGEPPQLGLFASASTVREIEMTYKRPGADVAAVFAGGSAAWEIETLKRIKEWLHERLPEAVIIG